MLSENRYAEPGVYLVLIKGVVVYVGQSWRLKHRVKYHSKRKLWERAGASFVFIPVLADDNGAYRSHLEYALIRLFQPRYNVKGKAKGAANV